MRTGPHLTPERVLQLKADAKQLKEAEGIKQTAALARIAQREGFRSWEELISLAGGRSTVDEFWREQREQQPTEAQVRRAPRRALFTGKRP